MIVHSVFEGLKIVRLKKNREEVSVPRSQKEKRIDVGHNSF